LALIVFAITLFVSAFLLFLVQPMIGKMILPKLGGTPQVWNTCMLFFQTVLLLGYFYTHATTTYLKPRRQMMLHGALLFLPLFVMLGFGMTSGQPIDVSWWEPPAGFNPIFHTLWLLAIVVGIPFFVVSTSAPLLQRWFSFSGDPTANDPYFLYGASNLGSLLSLAFYPFVIEPFATVPVQTWVYFVGYVILMALIFRSALLVWNRAEVAQPDSPNPDHVAPDPLPAETVPVTTAASTAIQSSKTVGKKKGLKGGVAAASAAATPSISRAPLHDPKTAPLTFGRCVRWALLAAVPSSLMLGVTSYVSTDLSPFPLVWAIPLAFYLLTFILVFAKWPIEWTREPHTLMLWVMPLLAVPIFCWILFWRNYAPGPIFFSSIAIAVMTLALHGELAKDRPAARHLTLFFLLMSFGGMLGGLFNALIAPTIFTGIWEYPLAVIVACFVMPNLVERGWVDGLILDSAPDLEKSMVDASDNFAKSFGSKPTGKPFVFVYFWDIVVGIIIALVAWYTTSHRAEMGSRVAGLLSFLGWADAQRSPQVYQIGAYLIPIILCIIVMGRKLRYAIGIAGLLFFGYILGERDRNILYADRSYFGVLKVLENDEQEPRGDDYARDPRDGKDMRFEAKYLPKGMSIPPYTYLMHGSTYHGRSYQIPELSRLATTYYHRFGPIGVIMERFNWFPGDQNTFWADNRMPASMVGLGATSAIGQSVLPLSQIVNAWSEPPFATVGLGTGTMASYVRPFQHLAYYEIDDKIRNMSEKDNPYFLFVKEARERGGNVEIIMGDARQSLEKEKKRYDEWLKSGQQGPTPMREGYYKAIVLDAFSSDAIPVHLITEEAIKLYLSKLTPDGVLMVHTSNRHLSLPEPVADICAKINQEYAKDPSKQVDWFVGKDPGGERGEGPRAANRVYSLGHFGSEYVMIARKGVLDRAKLQNAIRGVDGLSTVIKWEPLRPPGRSVWTDNYQNIVSIMR
jgi:hypothetical protein